MKVDVIYHANDAVKIIFDNRHGIDLTTAVEVNWLREKLDAWHKGEIDNYDEERVGWAYLGLRADGDPDYILLCLGEVWYEIPIHDSAEVLQSIRSGLDSEPTERKT